MCHVYTCVTIRWHEIAICTVFQAACTWMYTMQACVYGCTTKQAFEDKRLDALWQTCSILRSTNLCRDCGEDLQRLHITLYHITLHWRTMPWDYITLQTPYYLTWLCNTILYNTIYDLSSHVTYITFQHMTQGDITLHVITCHDMSLHVITRHGFTWQYLALHHIMLHTTIHADLCVMYVNKRARTSEQIPHGKRLACNSLWKLFKRVGVIMCDVSRPGANTNLIIKTQEHIKTRQAKRNARMKPERELRGIVLMAHHTTIRD